MQIYEELKKDHKQVNEMLERLVMLSDDDDVRDDLVEEIRDELVPHTHAEEAVFYNSLQALKPDDEKVMQGYRDHLEIERLLRMLQVNHKENLDWKKTASKLKEVVERHIEEEEGPIFTLAMKTLSKDEAEKIGAAFVELKGKVEDDVFMGTQLERVKNLMPPKLSRVLTMTPKEIRP